ncbi:MAG: hypothetical protein GYB68_19905 [Chloroflexi bacterium]|nr:hypothetical protein [Chloroflexota bacterium]
MAFSVEKLSGESILILEMSDPIEDLVGDLQELYSLTAGIIEEIEGPVYRIFNIHAGDLEFNHMLEWLGVAYRGGRGSVSDDRARTILVGPDDLVTFFSNSLKQEQYGSIEVRVASSLDAAIAMAREELARASS